MTERIGIPAGFVSEVIAESEDAGYYVRPASKSNRRTTKIILERTAGQAAAIQRGKQHEKLFSCLSEVEKVTLLNLLETVNRD